MPEKEAGGFYGQALSRAARVRLAEARGVEGLDEEIALLRAKLRQLVEEHPERTELLLKGISLLVKAVATRYKLSPKAQDDLYQNVVGVLKGIGDALWPEGFNGA